MKKMNVYKINYLFFLLIISLASCKKTTTTDPYDLLLSKPYDKVCFLSTHNSMNSTEKGFTVPNQTYSVSNQLKNGVLGLLIDTYDGDDGNALTYHALPLFGQEKLVDVLQEIKTFLIENPKKVVSIIFENNGSNVQLQKAIDSIELNKMTFIHTGSTWPTLQTMVDSNQRLVLYVEHDKLPRSNYLMYAWGTIFDTPYTFKSVAEFNCNVNRGGGGTRELYLVNHWLQNGIGLPDKNLAPQANTRAVLSQRVQDCATTNNHFINFLAVDFYEVGDAKAIVDSINYAN